MQWTTCYVETCRIRHGRSIYGSIGLTKKYVKKITKRKGDAGV